MDLKKLIILIFKIYNKLNGIKRLLNSIEIDRKGKIFIKKVIKIFLNNISCRF